MWSNPQILADLVTFTEEILNGKLHFLCSVIFFFSFLSIVAYNRSALEQNRPLK